MRKQANFKRNAKRTLAFLLTLLMLLSTFPQNVFAVKVRENDEYHEGKTLRPISEMFHLDRILEWKAWSSPDDDLNRASVPLRERFTGHVVNPLASAEGRVQALPLMNSKNDEDNSVNGDEFDVYAFDFWQYLDQMVFWDGPVPTADIIDAGHRNGVPVYGTLFFNWSSSSEDQKILQKFLVSEQRNGQTVYPVADKLIDIVEFYGFDGYFINQETHMYGSTWGAKMRDFMLYCQRRAKERKTRVRFSWYDAMSNSGGRHHYDAVTSGNDYFMKKYGADKQYASDEFFINFNWYGKTQSTINHMKSIDRDPFDAYAGFELQQRSYNTGIGYDDLVGPDKKLRISLGLFTPDSIRGMASNPEDYHEQERNFWVGFDGDPTTSADTNSQKKKWRGIARFVADKSAVMDMPFNTYFNTGHGKKWFIDGKLSKNEEWNSRGVQELLPTWRWWIRSTDSSPLAAKYDFDDAYNSGNSVKFHGDLSTGEENKIMLYSTKLDASASTKLKVAYKGSEGAKAFIDLGKTENYSEDGFTGFELPEAKAGEWKVAEIPVGSLAGEKIHSIRLRLVGTKENSAYSFNLGQLALYNDESKPESVTEGQVDEVLFRSSANAEARLSWTPVSDAEYYEVYQENSDGTKSIINATSSKYFYAEKITRDAAMQGTKQKLYVVSVGKNGVKSEPAEIELDWHMLVTDTDALPLKGVNLCLGAEVTEVSAENDSEPARNAINGTISSNSDKWCAAGFRAGYMSIRMKEPQTIRRVAVYHAQAGGEGDTMNTRDFTIQYKDTKGQWKVAHTVKGNTKAVTDFELATPVTAQEWKLDITYGDTSPWTAIRIYEWQMFEFPKDNKTDYIPMRWVTAVNTENNLYDITFKNVEKNAVVKLYRDAELAQLIDSKTAVEKGNVEFSGVELPIEQGATYGKVYYTTTAPEKEASIRMTLVYHKKTASVESVKLLQAPTKKVYAQGEPLKVNGGKIQVSYEGGEVKELNLTPSMVKGFNPNAITEQELTVEFAGVKAPETFTVQVKKEDEIELSAIKVKMPPKTRYAIGDEIDLTDGTIEAIYENLKSVEVAMTDDEVEVNGFDSSAEGEKELTIRYKGKETTLTVYINTKEQANKEKLLETINQAKLLTEEEMFEKADEDVKVALQEAIKKAQEIHDNPATETDAVAEATVELSQAVETYKNKVIKSVRIKENPTKVEYFFGEEFDAEGGVLEITHGNEALKEEVALTADMVSFNPEQEGVQNVTVTYKKHEAGSFEVTVGKEIVAKLAAAIAKAEEKMETDDFKTADAAKQEALKNILEIAKRLLQTGGEDDVIGKVIGEIEQAILDLTRIVEPLLPYVPEPVEPETPKAPKAPEVKIEDEAIALSPAQKALAEEISKNVTKQEDIDTIKNWVAKKLTDKEVVYKLSDEAFVEMASTVSETFKDEKATNWYAKELSAVRLVNLVEGFEDKTFKAEKEVTGQELTTMLVRLSGTVVEKAKEGENWFAPYKKAAQEMGLLKAIDFELDKELSREKVAALVYNFMMLSMDKTEVKEQNFKDMDKVNPKFKDAVHFLYEQEVVKGYTDGSFKPEAKVNRAEVVAILYRLLKK